jgi:hypothetical protein
MKPGPLVQAISGTAGNVNFRAVAGRTVVAARKARQQSPNAAQQLGPNFLAQCRALWNAGTDPERLAWISYARSTPSKNRFGQTQYLSGLQSFTHYMTSLWLASNQTFLWPSIPPPYLQVQPVDLLTTLTASFTSAGGGAYSVTPVPIDSSIRFLLLWAIRFGRGSQVPSRMWRFIGSVYTNGGAIDVTSIFQRPDLNWILISGEPVWLAAQTLDTAAGPALSQTGHAKTTVT